MEEQDTKPIAVKRKDLDLFGCPKCGHRGIIIQHYGRSGLWYCQNSDCHYACIALLKKAKKSSIAIEFYGEMVYPELCVHPRKGIPSHNGLSLKQRIEKLGLLKE